MAEIVDDGTIRVQFPGLTPGEAAAVARELQMELVAAGAPADDIRTTRDNPEAMDFGATLLIGAGMLGWEALRGVTKGAAHEIGRQAGRDAYEGLRHRIDAFCQRRRVAAAVVDPDGRTWMLRSEFERAVDDALPGDLATLGVILLGASVFPHLEGLDNPAFARSAAAARAMFAQPNARFAKTAVLDLFDQGGQPHELIDAIDRHIEAHPDMADLLIYYCGHGSFQRDRTYFLTLKGTRLGREASTGLKLKDLRHDLEARLANRRLYLVLDCCFAGAAVREFMGPNVERVVEEAVREALPPGGWVVLAAASGSVPAMAPAGQELTMFTGALAQVLRAADRPLSFDDIAHETRRHIMGRFGAQGVLPECHAPMQHGGDLRRAALFGGGLGDMAATIPRPVAPVKPPQPRLAPTTMAPPAATAREAAQVAAAAAGAALRAATVSALRSATTTAQRATAAMTPAQPGSSTAPTQGAAPPASTPASGFRKRMAQLNRWWNGGPDGFASPTRKWMQRAVVIVGILLMMSAISALLEAINPPQRNQFQTPYQPGYQQPGYGYGPASNGPRRY